MRYLILSITFACVALAQDPPTYPPFGPFSQLPAASGSVRAFTVTNCLTASCTAGGGLLKVLMVSDGSSWAPSGTGGGGGTSQYVNTINVASMTVNAGNHTQAHILLPTQPSSGYPLSVRMTATVAVTGTVVSSVNGFIGDSSFDLSSYGSSAGAASVLFNGALPGRTQDLSVLGSDFSQTYNLNALGTYSALYLTIQGNTGTDFSLAHAGTITVTLTYGGPAGPTGATGSAGAPGSGNNALCADATGSTTAYTCPTPSPTVSTLTGLLITLVPQATNTASATVNVAGLGVKTLKTSDCSTNLSASALVGGSAYLFSYNGTVFCQSAGAGGGGSGTVTSVAIGGTTNQINVTGTCTITTTGTCTLSLPSGLVLPGTIDGLTITTTTGTLTIVNAKVLTVNKSLTLDGTDGVTLTFPTTNATIARTDTGQTFSGTQVFSSPISGSITGNAATSTALAANPTNCSAGNYPLGIDAGGNVENCTPAVTGTSAVGNVTPVTVSANTTSDQALQEISIPAALLNTLAQPYLAHNSGIFTIALAQTPTLTFKAKLCTVSGCGSGVVVTLATITTTATVAATNNIWNLNLKLATTATGASGTILTHGQPGLSIDIGAVSTIAGTLFIDTNTASSSAINLAGVLFLDFTVSTSVGNAGNSFTSQISTIEPASSPGGAGPTGPTGPPGSVLGTVITYSANHALTQSDAGNTVTCSVNCTITFPSTLSLTVQVQILSTSASATISTAVSGTATINNATTSLPTFASCSGSPVACPGQTFTMDASGNWHSTSGVAGPTGAGATCGQIDPTCFTPPLWNPWNTWFGNYGSWIVTNAANGGPTGGTPVAPAGEPTEFSQRANSGQLSLILYPGAPGGSGAGSGEKDFASGSTPLLWRTIFTGGQRSGGGLGGDFFVGIMNSGTSIGTGSVNSGGLANFTGMYFNKNSNVFECVVGGTVTTAAMLTGDTNWHYFLITNAATWAGTTAVANSISIKIDNTQYPACTGTIPAAGATVGYYFVFGINGLVTNSISTAQSVDVQVGRMMPQISGLPL